MKRKYLKRFAVFSILFGLLGSMILNTTTAFAQNITDKDKVFSVDRTVYVQLTGDESEEIITEIAQSLNANAAAVTSMKGSQSGAHIGYQTSDGVLREFIPVQAQEELTNQVMTRAGVNITKVRQVILDWHFIIPSTQVQFWGAYYDILEDPNGNPLFCVEPSVLVNGLDSYSPTTMPSHVTTRMQQGASIGYSKVRDDAHYWNTHTFLYSEMGVQWIKNSGYDQNIQNEINAGIDNLAKRPSFQNKEVVLKMGEPVTIEDTNGVFKDYEKLLSNTSGVKVERNGNKITLTATADSNETGEIRFQRYNVEPISIAYVKQGSQTLAVLRDPDMARFTILVKVIKKGKVDLIKQDSVTGEIAQGAAVLEGAEYELIDSQGNRQVSKVVNGKAHFDDVFIGKGTYREITPPNGYNLDTKVYDFDLQPNGSTIHLERIVTDKVIEGQVSIVKFGNKPLNGIQLPEGQRPPLKDAEFTMTSDTTGEVADILVTDEDGLATSKKVPYDIYTVSETKTPKGYKPVEDFKVKVDTEGKIYHYILEDVAHESQIKIAKQDADSKELIAFEGVGFQIRIVSTGELLKQSINYPVPHEIDTFYTAADGTLVLPQALTAGDYELIEVEAPEGYLLSKEPVPFTVDENSPELLTVSMLNERVKGEISGQKLAEVIDVENSKDEQAYKYEKYAGAKFELLAEEDITTLDGITHFKKGEVVRENISLDENGQFKLENLELGDYRLVETETGEEYNKIDDILVSLTFKDSETAVVFENLEIKNDLKKGTAEISKKDIADEKELEGATLNVKGEDTDITWVSTTEDKVLTLKDGEYTLTEVLPNDGYELNTEVITFTVKDGETTKVTMHNKRIKENLPMTGERVIGTILPGIFFLIVFSVLVQRSKKNDLV